MGCSIKILELPVVMIIMIMVMLATTTSAQVGFRCSSNSSSTCNGLVGYTTTNATKLSTIKTLFNIKNLRTLLAANNLSMSTLPNSSIPANQTLKIPFPCFCGSGGFGISNHRPNYTVVDGDGLDNIARKVFGGLVTFPQIQQVNGLPDANKIFVGQRLWIPLPCSCDDVDGEKVVHYGVVVAPGSTIEGFAEQYNASQDSLLRLNNLTSPKELMAGAVLDVPLRTCSSMVSNNSLDYPLLVPNGSYVVTANNCVMCKCDASVSWTLQCEPAQINSSCPAIQCDGGVGGGTLLLGNTTTSSGCNRTTCAYAGYTSNHIIQTTLALESTCPASNNKSAAMSLVGWNGFVVVFMMLFCVPFFL